MDNIQQIPDMMLYKKVILIIIVAGVQLRKNKLASRLARTLFMQSWNARVTYFETRVGLLKNGNGYCL